MKTNRLLARVFSIFVFITWSMQVFAGISCRIQGEVTDKDTGKPIPGAWVLLYRVDYGIVKSMRTDSKGYFRFDAPDVYPGRKYFIQSKATGYITFIQEYYSQNVKPEYYDEVFHPFIMAEGQIKHIKITLGKGGSLKGVLFKKGGTGISSFEGVTVFLRKKKKPNEYFLIDTNDKERFDVADTETDDQGEFSFYNLEPSDDSMPDEYIIELYKFGYYIPEKTIIKIQKGIETQLEYTVDLTKFLELKGKVTVNGEPATDGEVILNSKFLKSSEDSILINSLLDEKGNYSFQGILPGVYYLSIICFDSYKKIVEEKKLIEIKEGKSEVLDMNFEVER